MKTNQKNKNLKNYYADTETTTYNPEHGVRVYLWCVVSDNNLKCSGRDIESLYKFIIRHAGHYYFHNLKFDWSFLEYYLIENKIKYRISERKGNIYQIQLGDSVLLDSMNLVNCSLADLGLTFCKTYQKTSIDYTAATWAHKATPEEIKYCYNDCFVLREGLQAWKSELLQLLERNGATKTAANLNNKLTYAGIAFDAFKELSDYDTLCPKTTILEYNLWIGAYHGGYVYSKPAGVVKGVTMVDCNSMYPYIYMTKRLPFGYAHRCDDYAEVTSKDFYIIKVLISFDIKDGYIPIIGNGFGKYGGINYQTTTNGGKIELVICKYDWELLQDFYHYDAEMIWGYWWDTMPEFYKNYGDIFMTEKKNAKSKTTRTLAKMMLNSPYGKTAMNGIGELRDYFIDEKDLVVKSRITGYNADLDAYQYLPQAISITAQARQYLLKTAEKVGFDKVQYMDTDSIKFIDDGSRDLASLIWIDDKELGAWKVEGHPQFFKTLASKKYITYEDGVLEITCAGFGKKALNEQLGHGKHMPEAEALDFIQRFDKGLTIRCLQSKKVRGGRALLEIDKQII